MLLGMGLNTTRESREMRTPQSAMAVAAHSTCYKSNTLESVTHQHVDSPLFLPTRAHAFGYPIGSFTLGTSIQIQRGRGANNLLSKISGVCFFGSSTGVPHPKRPQITILRKGLAIHYRQAASWNEHGEGEHQNFNVVEQLLGKQRGLLGRFQSLSPTRVWRWRRRRSFSCSCSADGERRRGEARTTRRAPV